MNRPRISSGTVPVFQLYGEDGQWLTPDLVHCEAIAVRSRLHNWEIRPHSHHGLFQLLWLDQGRASVELDEYRGQLRAGTVLLVPQHCIHGFQFSPDAQGLVVTIAYSLLGRLGSGLGEELSALAAPLRCDLGDVSSRAVFESSLLSLQTEYENHARYRLPLIDSLLTCALGWLFRHQAAAASDEAAAPAARARQHLSRFSALADADYATHATLDTYAMKLGISTAHLNALCRQLTGQSALQLIHARLVLEARRQLVYTSMTIADVSDMLGFSDPAYFTRFFKRQTGVSPRNFRQHAERLAGEQGEEKK